MKMLLLTLLFFAASYIGCTSAASIRTTANVIDTIPKSDRTNFILYELLNAVHATQRTDILFNNPYTDLDMFNQTMHTRFNTDITDDFPTKLLTWVESEVKNGNFPEPGRHRGSGSSVCFPSGCVDPGDIGSVCCPF